MEKKVYDEMVANLEEISRSVELAQKNIFLFGHCNATLELVDLLESKNIKASAILDNSINKQGKVYKGIEVVSPERIVELAGDAPVEESMVFITSRFYAAMHNQLRELGYEGPVRKLIDYNTYAEYSMSEDTIDRMTAREKHGEELLNKLYETYHGHFITFCPYNALGDIYFTMSYWEAFAQKRGIGDTVFCVPSPVLVDVIRMFGDYPVSVYEQKELDAMIQAALFTHDENTFIAHHDRPYIINLSKALYIKKIPLEKIFCCGVFGLPVETIPSKPRHNINIYSDIEAIPEGKSVIFSPYAKSIIPLEPNIWRSAVDYYSGLGYKCFTNVVGDEKPLGGTEPISPSIMELTSVVERAGIFIGIRSGLCDVIREAKAKKIALYPDYNYCDTKWKAIDMYWIEQFDKNILAGEDIEWETL